jgi:hypothetical protein
VAYLLPNHVSECLLSQVVVNFNLLKTIIFVAFISCDQWFELPSNV